MSYKKLSLFIILIGLLFTGAIAVFPQEKADAFSEQVIQHGAVGDDVIELQARLQYLGFYNSQIDGVFGWGTYCALRNFQYEFGMEEEGFAGNQTKQKLTDASDYDEQHVREQINQGRKSTHYGGTDNQQQSTSQGDDGGGGEGGGAPEQPAQEEQEATNTAVNVPQGFSQNDIQLMANAVYGEARGEPYEGQ